MQYTDNAKPIWRLLFSLYVTLPSVLFGMTDDLLSLPLALEKRLAADQKPQLTVQDQQGKPDIELQTLIAKKSRKVVMDDFLACLVVPFRQLKTNRATITQPLHEDDRDKVELIDRLLLAAIHRLRIHRIFIQKEVAELRQVGRISHEEAHELKELLKKKDTLAHQELPSRVQAILKWHARNNELEAWHAEKPQVNQADQERLALLDPELITNQSLRQLLQLDATRFPADDVANEREITKLARALDTIEKFLKADDALPKQKTREKKGDKEQDLTKQQPIAPITQRQGSSRARRLSVVEEKG